MNIHEAAAAGDLRTVREELQGGVSVDACDERGETLLACAARSPEAEVEMLHLLIEFGADVNRAVEEREHFPLQLAACSGHVGKVACLLEAGADIRQVVRGDYTVLLNVVYALNDRESLVPMMELLVRHGVDVDQESAHGESPLVTAARFGRFDGIQCLLEAGADPEPLDWSPLEHAVALGTINDVAELLQESSQSGYAEPSPTHAIHLAAQLGDLAKVQLLAAQGFETDGTDERGETPILFAAQYGRVDVLRWLIHEGVNLEAVDGMDCTSLMLAAQGGHAECVRLLLAAGADPERSNEFQDSAISVATNELTVRLLVSAGLDLGDVSREMKRKLIGLPQSAPIDVTPDEYRQGRDRRFGGSNPEVMDVPFWQAMVRAGENTYQPRKQFGDKTFTGGGPVWCFDRFGMSFTELPGGRFVQIGGEHEDYYDPDFCIYNDVVVHDRAGTFEILGYPKEEFPPTDFHSTTLVDGALYIVGGLGYPEARALGTTPVYRLDCRTWKIEKIETRGENPGWLYNHKARLDDRHRLIITGGTVCDGTAEQPYRQAPNEGQFCLDVVSMTWTRL